MFKYLLELVVLLTMNRFPRRSLKEYDMEDKESSWAIDPFDGMTPPPSSSSLSASGSSSTSNTFQKSSLNTYSKTYKRKEKRDFTAIFVWIVLIVIIILVVVFCRLVYITLFGIGLKQQRVEHTSYKFPVDSQPTFQELLHMMKNEHSDSFKKEIRNAIADELALEMAREIKEEVRKQLRTEKPQNK
jgi:hypothetical protein